MIRAIGQNDVLEAILLMNKSNEQNDYKGIERNQNTWIRFFCNLVDKQSKKDPNALVDDPIAEENSPELRVPSVLICALIQNDIVKAIVVSIFFMLVVFCVFLHFFCQI